ncbi:M48 family metallopeptidase [Candidatus Micrarchaeota archaeon]|nr:M48 family metallopeptidase [Candidatus Micrarchaeota archaeon]
MTEPVFLSPPVDVQEAFLSAAALLGKTDCAVKAQFRNFASLKATLQRQGNTISANVSPGFAAGGRDVLVGLALDLTARAYRMRVPDNAYTRAYREFRRSQNSNQLNNALKRSHGRKRNLQAQGAWHDLNDIVLRMTREYPLLQTLSVPKMGWNAKGGSRILGFYDESAHEILINANLDQKRVPPFVLEYVIFHELLHAKHPVKHGRSRRTIHTTEFKREERQYPFYDEAMAWLKRNNVDRDWD